MNHAPSEAAAAAVEHAEFAEAAVDHLMTAASGSAYAEQGGPPLSPCRHTPASPSFFDAEECPKILSNREVDKGLDEREEGGTQFVRSLVVQVLACKRRSRVRNAPMAKLVNASD